MKRVEELFIMVNGDWEIELNIFFFVMDKIKDFDVNFVDEMINNFVVIFWVLIIFGVYIDWVLWN